MLEAQRVLGAVPDELVAQALAHWTEGKGAKATPLGRGLINETYELRSATGHYVLQRVSPIFDPEIHHNIRAVTERLAARGVETPRLLATQEGAVWVDLGEGGNWRLLTFVGGASFDVPQSDEQAHSAGALVARFHAALDGLHHRFVGRRLGVHDTAAHLLRLRQALRDHGDHRLRAAVQPLAERILHAAAELPPLPLLPERVCHGDLKFNNLRFGDVELPERDRALCLIDLDTVGPMSLAHELGDAWRSWCNPAGEDAAGARFDLRRFEAAWAGYRDHLGGELSEDQRRALLHGVEWISLELSARFAADALTESYFGWDGTRYPAAGEHNLARASCQWSLHESTVDRRHERARLLGVPAQR